MKRNIEELICWRGPVADEVATLITNPNNFESAFSTAVIRAKLKQFPGRLASTAVLINSNSEGGISRD